MQALRTTALIGAFLLASSSSAQIVPGDLFVSEYAAGSVVNVRGGGDFSAALRFATGLSGPRGLCVGPEGDLYVAELDSGEVTVITGGGDFALAGSFASGLAAPVGLLCDDEQILVVESGEGSGEVTDITAGGDFSGAPAFAGGIGDAAALMRDATGRLFASDSTGGRIFDVSAGGVFLSVPPFATGGGGTGGMTERAERLLGANATTDQVIDFTDGGDLTLLPVFATVPGVVNVRNVEGLGLFAVSDTDDAVYEISAQGDFSGTTPFASGVAVDLYAGIAHVRGCGDGILEVESGEVCDDGNLVSGDGCNQSCRVRLCLIPPAPTCIDAGQASLSFKGKREGREKLKLKLSKLAEPVSQSQFGIPTFDSTRYDICIYDGGGTLQTQLIVDRGFQLCGPKDRSCWTPISDKGYRYKDPEADEDGIRSILAVGGAKAGKGKLQIQGSNKEKKNQNRLPSNIARNLEGETSATVQVMVSDAGCFGATLTDVKKNDDEQFSAKR